MEIKKKKIDISQKKNQIKQKSETQIHLKSYLKWLFNWQRRKFDIIYFCKKKSSAFIQKKTFYRINQKFNECFSIKSFVLFHISHFGYVTLTTQSYILVKVTQQWRSLWLLCHFG